MNQLGPPRCGSKRPVVGEMRDHIEANGVLVGPDTLSKSTKHDLLRGNQGVPEGLGLSVLTATKAARVGARRRVCSKPFVRRAP